MSKSSPALRMTRITKTFPGIRALSEVDLEVAAGEVHAIVGENGAGKSTLMKILSGIYQPDEGSIELAGKVVRISDPIDARKRGIGMVYQELNLVPELSVAENITLGSPPSRFGLVNRAALRARAEEILEELDAKIRPDELVGSLPVSKQQLVEIAKAYASAPRIMVLDEPTSSLSENEAQSLFKAIRRLKASGIAIIYISHRLREVVELADHVTVLRDGALVETRRAEGITPADMIRLMVGRDLTEVFPKRDVPIGDVVLRVNGLSRQGAFADIDVTVCAGEIVGLAGFVGAGRTEVARAIFGLDRADQGSIEVNGTVVSGHNARRGVAAGIAYVPEDRKRDGLVPQLSVKDNITLASLGDVSTAGWIRQSAERRVASQKATELGVSPPVIDRLVSTYSGGNQQKVVFAKWLATRPDVLILDEPTRGVDVGAKADIHTIIGELAAQGTAIVMISSELPEVLAVCDRIYVLHEGRISAELPRGVGEQDVMRAATGEVLT